MRVLILAASLDEKSGWGRHALAIAEHLTAAGTEVEIFVENPPKGLPYRMHRLHSISCRFPIIRLLQNAILVRRVAKKFPIIHALDGWPIGVYGFFSVLGRKKKLFINGVGTYSVAPLYAFGKGLLMQATYRRAAKIFCISRYTAQELVRAGVAQKKLVVVHFGTPVLKMPSAVEEQECRRAYNIALDRFPILLTVGAIKDRKGQLETLRAVSLLKEQYPHILYVAAGSANQASYVEEMRHYAKEHGLVDNLLIVFGADDRIITFLYSICSIFALNSNTDDDSRHFEGFGAVISEAYQFGKPAVGSSGCGIEDAIEDGVSGLLSVQRDPQDIANKVRIILQHYDIFSTGAKSMHEQFSWDKTIAEYKNFYSR